MRVVLLNPRHTAIGSRVPGELLPPLGLLAVGGPLIDAGFDCRLVNADLDDLCPDATVAAVAAHAPDAVLMGHSGSSTAHPTVADLSRRLRAALPGAVQVYGGVHPSYHWREVLEACPGIDWIVRGEGEATAPSLMAALRDGTDPIGLPGVAGRAAGTPRSGPPARMLEDLDAARIGWELIDVARHTYWGGLRSVILQFSRGCPHLCTYCGQRGFWTRWRHRDPVRFAAEIARLVREDGVELVNLADENPTSSRRAWKAFLEAMVAEGVDVQIVGSTRADDIVRDSDLLPLYRRAGVTRFLLGLEGTDETTLTALRKGGTRSKDREAIRLLRAHGMIGLATFAVGFEEETDADYWRLLRTLLAYDPDQVMSVHATPHRWTPFFAEAKRRRVVQPDLRRWDYKHQVMDVPAVPPWRVFLWVKLIEAALQLRPRSLWRTYLQPDRRLRHAMRWYARMGRRVWLSEFADALWRVPARRGAATVAEVAGADPLPEQAMDPVRVRHVAAE
ncbi:magnesium-protoporphyrin IX monomethyl ester anaerobic oxidative cyclase [Jannaschia sp. Os4]|uniref:magnesium-protoporphyrin IX monomethyl ester anaerobic oxidative cyclase n=1 Tax=Jannaschia sp. Os4 TaxID=2807617 RepID=UPI001939E57B|nr:magnesium-protoporphyrin IX monomethyl ester anaerobic oxidative cyclase [Jannaschia sp. Os4]